jgi:hypothetical protein
MPPRVSPAAAAIAGKIKTAPDKIEINVFLFTI